MEIATSNDLEALSFGNETKGVLMYFWAEFHPACAKNGQIDQLLSALKSAHNDLAILKVNAELEDFESAIEKYKISAVPAFVLFLNKPNVKFNELKMIGQVITGVNPQILNEAIDKALQSNAPNLSTNKNDAQEQIKQQLNVEKENEKLFQRLKILVKSSPVMLFIKGTVNDPKCKFSRELVEILKAEFSAEDMKSFGSFNILDDNEVREGLKLFSNWQTYPQVYAQGKLIGGLNSIKELQASGKLKEALLNKVNANSSSNNAKKELSLEDKLKGLINRNKVMLFMKGSPSEPRCGFSRRIVGILTENQVTFDSFDILEDNSVREGLKTYSNWPTYPQLYVNGELIGGLDILEEMVSDKDSGTLKSQLGLGDDNKMSLAERLKSLINQSKVMLFMKGTPSEPRCGFSRQIVEILQNDKVQFGSFDILSDEEVRQGLKTYSNWPTYPQIYVNGQLLGGLDIVKEMQSEGELSAALNA